MVFGRLRPPAAVHGERRGKRNISSPVTRCDFHAHTLQELEALKLCLHFV